MSRDVVVRRLRPYLFHAFRRSQCPCPLRAFSCSPSPTGAVKERDVTHDYEKRVEQLKAHKPLFQCYPRLSQTVTDARIQKGYLEITHGRLDAEETDTDIKLSLVGKVRSVRTAGSKLVFVDILASDGTVQAVCKLSKLQENNPSIDSGAFKSLNKIIRKGDVYSVAGHPHRTARGELSILATELPVLQAPSLHQIPEALEDAEARVHARHVDMLVNPEAIRTIYVRHEVEAGLQDFFNNSGFTKVVTPILSAGTGGATARPFETEATELTGEKLSLRIAPELWLKRLVVGGMEKVYELGPAFRNEGIDATHNPEFNICEFYQAYATLADLMQETQRLIAHLADRFEQLRTTAKFADLPDRKNYLHQSYNTIEFIPSLQSKMGMIIPDLQSTEAQEKIQSHFDEKHIPKPANPTLPRLLDALSAHYLEPLSHAAPTFITHHPACLSPLSKHFRCPTTSQAVAARAELFMHGREYANMYEEENSPFEQRRKFQEQLRLRETDAEAMQLDESYLKALEWGLPPTGGWGCGVDRLVMLFAARDRLADVLPFGSLRNVVALGRAGRAERS